MKMIIKALLKKEFKQIFRNKVMLKLMIIMPIVQLLVLVNAASFEIKDAKITFNDKDNSEISRELIRKFERSKFFIVNKISVSDKENNNDLLKNRTDAVINIPKDFERKIKNGSQADIQVLINAINSMKSGIINGYISSILLDYNQKIIPKSNKSGVIFKTLNFIVRYWYNPMLNYKIYMVPGILVILVTLIGMFLTSLNLVREKEIGTAEQINVTPVKKYQFLICKLLPFWFIGLFELALGLILGVIIFSVPINGSLLVLFVFASVFLLVALGIGLFFSTIAETQQQVMFMAYFFLLTFIIMSGIFTPVESMPQIAQYANYLNPLYFFMKAIRMILISGSGFFDLFFEFIMLSIYAIIINFLAILNYRKSN